MELLRSRSGWDKALFLVLGIVSTVFGQVWADWRDDSAGLESASRPVVGLLASNDPGPRESSPAPPPRRPVAPVAGPSTGPRGDRP